MQLTDYISCRTTEKIMKAETTNFECDIKLWGSRENNIIQAIKGYNPGHVAISVTIDGEQTDTIAQKLEQLKTQGVPVYHYEQDGQKQSQVYFSFWPYDEDKLGQEVEKPAKSKHTKGSIFYRLTRVTYKRKFATPYDDATDQRQGKLPSQDNAVIILPSLQKDGKIEENKMKQYEKAQENAQRRKGSRQTLWKTLPLNLTTDLTLSESQALDFLAEYNNLYRLAKTDETRNNLQQVLKELFSLGPNQGGHEASQEDLKAEIINAFNSERHLAYNFITACHNSIREEEALFKQIKQSQNPDEKQELQKNHTQLKYQILLEQHLLSCLGYSEEAALGQPADDTVTLTQKEMDLGAMLDKMLKLSEPNEEYEMTGQNCSSSALAVIAAGIRHANPDLNKHIKLLQAAEIPPQQTMRSPSGVYRLLTQKSDRQKLLIIRVLQDIVRILKTIASSTMKYSTSRKK